MSEKLSGGKHYMPFVVDQTPYCVWDAQLATHNMMFIRGVNPDYFSFQASLLESAPEESQRDLMAIAARSFYVHALESTLALLFAGLQAPQCVFAWIQRYNPKDLDALVRKVNEGTAFKTRCTKHPDSWEGIADFYLTYMPGQLTASDGKQVEKSSLIPLLAKALRNLANDYLELEIRHGYNAMKHGFRIMPGSVRAAFVPEKSPGVVDEKAEPFVLGGSDGGAAMFEVVAEKGRTWNLRVSWRADNWDFGQTVQRLQLAGVWMACLKAGLRAHLHDTEQPPPKWVWIADENFYEAPWKGLEGVRNVNLNFGDFDIPDAITKDWILASYEPQ